MKNYHFRKVPNHIMEELSQLTDTWVSIVATRYVSMSDIMAGQFSHVRITATSNGVQYQDLLLPTILSGTYARRNKDGYDIVHKDKPKVMKTIWWESPNFGDPSKGYHDNYRDIWVYPRTHVPAREWEVSIHIEQVGDNNVKIVARLEPSLERGSSRFDEDLFFAINLMQEQFRDCHIVAANLTAEQIAQTIHVGWEFFPEGTLDQTIERVIGRMRAPSNERIGEVKRRVNILDRFNPKRYIYGEGMSSRYFGAMMEEDIVVFENLDYGNAIYILSDNWTELSRMSRIDILRKHENEYIRILHKSGWEKHLGHTLAELRKSRNNCIG